MVRSEGKRVERGFGEHISEPAFVPHVQRLLTDSLGAALRQTWARRLLCLLLLQLLLLLELDSAVHLRR